MHLQRGIQPDDLLDLRLLVVREIQSSSDSDFQNPPVRQRHDLLPLLAHGFESTGEIEDVWQNVPVIPAGVGRAAHRLSRYGFAKWACLRFAKNKYLIAAAPPKPINVRTRMWP